jgi:hypothetical protein
MIPLELKVYAGVGAVAALLVWSGFRPPRSRKKSIYRLLTAVIACLLAVTFIPSLQPLWLARIHSPCTTNLKQIQTAKAEWVRLFPGGFAKMPQEDDLFGADKYIPVRPTCPEGGRYRIGTLGDNPTCSLVGTQHRLRGSPSFSQTHARVQKLFTMLCGAGLVAFIHLLWGVWRVKRIVRKLLLAGLAAVLILGIFLGLPVVVASSRVGRSHSACSANLQQIQQAKEKWSVDFKKARTDFPNDADLFGPGQYIPVKPTCPAGGTYRLGAVREKPTCTSVTISDSYHTFDCNL